MTSQVIFTMTSFTITTRILQFLLLIAQRTSCKSPVTFLSCVCDISACKFMHAFLTFNGLIVDTRPRDVALDFKDGAKISPCVDLINKGKNYSVQVFTTMSGVYGWIGLCSPLITVEFFSVHASVMFYITFHLLSNRGFKIFQVWATECMVVLLFRHNLIFVFP